jgi:drug/metabolite transporter (DMT)-like permease
MFVGFSMQAIGLQFTSAARSALVLYMNVVLVPVFGSACFGRTVHMRAWMKALVVLVDSVLLSHDDRMPNVGDAWCLSAAVSSAAFILRLESAAQKFDAVVLSDFVALSLTHPSLCLTPAPMRRTVAVLSSLWLIATEGLGGLKPNGSEMGVALYLGTVPTALCSFLISAFFRQSGSGTFRQRLHPSSRNRR